MKRTVICYYEPIDNLRLSEDSLALVDIWKKNWESKGWNPIVLSKKDAISNSKLGNIKIEDFNSSFYQFSPNNPKYLMHCYLRWYAYTNFVLENKEDCLWCDYDVFNQSFSFKKAGSVIKNQACILANSGSCGYMTKQSSKTLLEFFEDFFYSKDFTSTSDKFSEFYNINLQNKEDKKLNDMFLIEFLCHHLKVFSRIPITFEFRSKNINFANIKKVYNLFHIHGGVNNMNNNFLEDFDRKSKRSDIYKYIIFNKLKNPSI